MKFQPDTAEGVNLVTRQEPGRIWVGAEVYTHSLLLPWKGTVQDWGPATVQDLLPEHFARIVALKPEVVLFGSGLRLRFPAPALLRALIEARIGVETMDTAAACRTYNVLVSERRSAVAALLVENTPT
jgi:uncharacterized protein